MKLGDGCLCGLTEFFFRRCINCKVIGILRKHVFVEYSGVCALHVWSLLWENIMKSFWYFYMSFMWIVCAVLWREVCTSTRVHAMSVYTSSLLSMPAMLLGRMYKPWKLWWERKPLPQMIFFTWNFCRSLRGTLLLRVRWLFSQKHKSASCSF